MAKRGGRASSKFEKGSAKVSVPREAISVSPIKNGRDKPRPYRVDPDDEEYIRDLQRPAVIKEDLSEMERRRRVHQVLDAKGFCQTLERIMQHERECASDDGEQLRLLSRLGDFTVPILPTSTSFHTIGGCPIPIADIRNNDKYGEAEVVARNKLAALVRLVDVLHWSQGVYSHLTLRGPCEGEVLTNPFGVLFHETSASSLIRATVDGRIVDHGSTLLGLNKAAFLLHSAILSSRPDIACVIHLQSAIVTAVSSLKCGLLPICQEAMLLGPVAYHDEEAEDDEEEKAAIVRDLGDRNVLVLRNNGIVTVGATLEEAVLYARNVVAVCETQIRASKAGLENIHVPSERALRRAHDMALKAAVPKPESNGHSGDETDEGIGTGRRSRREWAIGELEWEAFMRLLDNAGFRTGHRYRQPQLKHGKQLSFTLPSERKEDIASPPASSAYGTVDESDPEALKLHKIAMMKREQERANWLNSPSVYQKIEILESGTDQPKIITKWVQDHLTPSANGTPIKIQHPNQFAPISENSKEFRIAGLTSPGPQSVFLDSGRLHEVHFTPETTRSQIPESRSVTLGTASKGIIERDHQHNAQVYRQMFAVNPFTNETDEDLKQYLDEMVLKSPQSSQRIEESFTYVRSDSPFRAESPGYMDNVSLIRGAREFRLRQLAAKSASLDDETETTTGGPTTDRSAPACDLNKNVYLDESFCTTVSARSVGFTSDDEVAKEAKKKKKGLFSFMRRSKRGDKKKS